VQQVTGSFTHQVTLTGAGGQTQHTGSQQVGAGAPQLSQAETSETEPNDMTVANAAAIKKRVIMEISLVKETVWTQGSAVPWFMIHGGASCNPPNQEI